MTECPKCHGTKIVNFNYEDGKCFLCQGIGEITEKRASYIKLQNDKITTVREAKREQNAINEQLQKEASKKKKEQEILVGYKVRIETLDGQIVEKQVSKRQLENINNDIKYEVMFKSVTILK